MTEAECPCQCHGGPGAYGPACTIVGGCGPHNGPVQAEAVNRCQRGRRCHDPERHDDHLVGAPCDRALCDPCERAVTRALDDAPALYLDLRNATLIRDHSTQHSEKVTKSAGSPMPLNSRALDLGEQLHWLLTTWEEIVRDIARLTPPERDGRREGRQVTDAAALLGAHLSAWIAAPPTVLATSRWTDDVEQSGAQAACALLDWRSTVRNLPGLDAKAPKAIKRYEQRCPACGVRAITHRAGDDLMQCQSCGATERFVPTLPAEDDVRQEAMDQRVHGMVAGRERPHSDVAGQDARSGRAAHAFEEGSAA